MRPDSWPLVVLFAVWGAADFGLCSGAVAETIDYQRDVAPILTGHCSKCHGEEKQKSDLRVDHRPNLLRGGGSGEPAIVPGKGADSLLIKLVSGADPDEIMPPKGERLTGEQVGILKMWIDQGAKMPGLGSGEHALSLTTDFWSFQPVRRPATTAGGQEIDGLVRVKLREKGLEMSVPADRQTLIRRLYLVAHGLPPTPRQVHDFLSDSRHGAYARLVDRVLQSPRYGERWARHWMDVVRYADTNGFETNRERPSAYHYRDYIIESFNSDRPYDQFVKEQIAGDALGTDAATGFLVAGPYDVVKGKNPALRVMQRQDELADIVNATGTAFLGLTMGCARCHNHKFDPILQKDYYALQAVFAGVNHGKRAVPGLRDEASEQKLAAMQAAAAALKRQIKRLETKTDSVPHPTVAASPAIEKGRPAALRPAVNATLNQELFAPTEALAVRFTILGTNRGAPCIDELEVFDDTGENVALGSLGSKATASGTLSGYDIHKLEHVCDGRTGNSRSWIASTTGNGWVQIEFPSKRRIHRIVWSRDREGRYFDRLATRYRIEVATAPERWLVVASSDDRKPLGSQTRRPGASDRNRGGRSPDDAQAIGKLRAKLDAVNRRLKKLADEDKAWVGVFRKRPERTHRLYRGDPMQQREVVAPDALAVLGSLGMDVDEPEQRRRVRLAEWIASPDNPLTARVLVNRLWHYTFGIGIVDTPSDFGANGGRPTHPDLLDWLADEFVRSGWSIKHIQRLILMSETFRQASVPRREALKVDADGRYLWRFTPRRLEAEAIRDSMLAVSGAIDLRMGGPGFYLMDVQRENVVHYFPKKQYSPAEFRRMVYLFRVRNAHDDVFGSFDCPDGSAVMPRRSRSNTPLQALNLFNSHFVIQQSDLLAKRLGAEAGEVPEAQVDMAFRLCFARSPDELERKRSVEFIHEHGLQSFARALYNMSEFLFVF